ncbi:MAG: PKD domain-containing protein [Nitrosopumilaceae archaeon]
MRNSTIFAIISIVLFSMGLGSFAAYSDTMPQNSQSNNYTIVYGNTQITLSGLTSSDPQNFPLGYLWVQTAGDPVTISSNTAPEITFRTPDVALGDTKYLTFSLTVNNSISGKSTTTYTLQVIHASPPVVTTQHEIIVPQLSQVSLTGSGTDSLGGTVSLMWTQTSGDNVIISSPDQPTATFTAPSVEMGQTKTLTFLLTGTNGAGLQASDTETVTVTNLVPITLSCPPIMKAKPGSPITISPQIDNPYNAPLTFVWREGSGDQIAGLSTNTQNLSFTVPSKLHGYELSFTLTAYEGKFPVANCESYIYFSYLEEGPVTANYMNVREFVAANAGFDQTVPMLSQVTLDGSKSVGKNLIYSWTQTAGSQVTLLDSFSPHPSFTAPNDVPKGGQEVLEFTLTVSNGLGQDSSKVKITVINPAEPPTARITLK